MASLFPGHVQPPPESLPVSHLAVCRVDHQRAMTFQPRRPEHTPSAGPAGSSLLLHTPLSPRCLSASVASTVSAWVSLHLSRCHLPGTSSTCDDVGVSQGRSKAQARSCRLADAPPHPILLTASRLRLQAQYHQRAKTFQSSRPEAHPTNRSRRLASVPPSHSLHCLRVSAAYSVFAWVSLSVSHLAVCRVHHQSARTMESPRTKANHQRRSCRLVPAAPHSILLIASV